MPLQALELDIPDEADNVAALRIALLQLKEALPLGALIERDEDVRASSSGSEKGPKALVVHWTEAFEAQWVNHLMEAKTPQEVRTCLCATRD
jgi:hypothetical protein